MEDEKKSPALVVVQSGEPVVSSEVLAEGFDVTHQAVLKLIEKYHDHFQSIKPIGFEIRSRSSGKWGGKDFRFCNLNEEQAAFLGTLLRNNDRTVAFKLKLTREFFRIRQQLAQVLAQKQNTEWLEKRQAGKLIRKEETSHIKRFVEYAKAQGSESAEKYYMVITKMQNAALFLFDQKFKNLRDALGINQLSIVTVADTIVSRAISDGLETRLHYKDIYKLMKARIESFAAIHGKSFVPAALQAPKQPLLIECEVEM